jgi:TniQ
LMKRVKTSLPTALVGVPPPLLLEAPSSWLSRVALQQGAELREVREYLGWPASGSVDMQFLHLGMKQLQDRVGTSLERFDCTRRVLSNIHRIDPDGNRLLFKDAGHGQFRYCPACLKAQPVPHVPIHWRVVTWRYCPEHECLLNTACPHCAAPTLLPVDLINAGPRGKGVAYLRDCARCGHSLAAQEPCELRRSGPGALSHADLCLLENGRATLAALHTGRVGTVTSDRMLGLQRLMFFVKRGLVPNAAAWLEPRGVRRAALAADAARAHSSALARQAEQERWRKDGGSSRR